MKSFVFNICAFSEPVQDMLIEQFELNPFNLHFVCIETNAVETNDEFIGYVKKKGFPEDAKITIFKDCYPFKCESGDNATNTLKGQVEIDVNNFHKIIQGGL